MGRRHGGKVFAAGSKQIRVPGDAEVKHLDLSGRSHEDVGRLEVPLDDRRAPSM